MDKHFIWAVTIFLIVTMVCGTVIWINYNSWTVRFEMDDNMKEAIESIEYPIVDTSVENYSPLDECGLLYKNGTMIEINCDVLEVENDGK